MRWTVVGSGPSGHDLTAKELAGTVIVVNTAVQWVPLDLVDYYFFRKARMHQMFPDLLARGIKLIAFKRKRGELWHPDISRQDRMRGIDPAWVPAVEQLVISKDPWQPGLYSPHRDPIGPQAVEYALGHGATRVDLYGLEGGDVEKDGSIEALQAEGAAYHREVLQVCVNTCPNVRFIIHGSPLYKLEGDNVELVDHHRLGSVRQECPEHA